MPRLLWALVPSPADLSPEPEIRAVVAPLLLSTAQADVVSSQPVHMRVVETVYVALLQKLRGLALD